MIGEFNATTGAAIASDVISGTAQDLAISGNNLFTTNYADSAISEYTLSGSAVNTFEISAHGDPTGIAIEAVPEPSEPASYLAPSLTAGLTAVVTFPRFGSSFDVGAMYGVLRASFFHET
jgi:hypothetical protein